MSEAPQKTRKYQVEQFTRGTELPLPALERRHIKFIAEVLEQAWKSLLEIHGDILYAVSEAELNALMESQLDEIRCSKPDWAEFVSGVTRGKESISFDGSSLEKRPDLSLHLTSRLFRLPLVIECKLIDTATGKGIQLYCDKGLVRFIDGQYGWYGVEAFMMAYVRDTTTIAASLTPHLDGNTYESPDPYLTQELPKPVKGVINDFSLSRHGRRFPGNPGAINIWHLWLT